MEKFLMLDTETTNDIDCPICYDVGFAVIDTTGKIYEEGSYVVADVFLDKELMSTAYFIDKVPAYWEEIKAGKRILRRWSTIRKIVRDVMAQWEIKKVVAHNARFDYRSTATTQRYLTSSKYRFFFPYGTEFIDTLKMSREIFGVDTDYKKFCEHFDYKCKNGTPRFTAEIIYRFLTNDTQFDEAHTALEDVHIEATIFAECIKRKPTVNGLLWQTVAEARAVYNLFTIC